MKKLFSIFILMFYCLNLFTSQKSVLLQTLLMNKS